MTRNEFKTENSGENQGVIVGQNSGILTTFCIDTLIFPLFCPTITP